MFRASWRPLLVPELAHGWLFAPRALAADRLPLESQPSWQARPARRSPRFVPGQLILGAEQEQELAGLVPRGGCHWAGRLRVIIRERDGNAGAASLLGLPTETFAPSVMP